MLCKVQSSLQKCFSVATFLSEQNEANHERIKVPSTKSLARKSETNAKICTNKNEHVKAVQRPELRPASSSAPIPCTLFWAQESRSPYWIWRSLLLRDSTGNFENIIFSRQQLQVCEKILRKL